MPARVLILSFSDLSRDPRVRRQLHLLREEHTVTAAGFVDPCLPGVRFVDVSGAKKTSVQRIMAAARLAARRHAGYYWNVGYVRHAADALQGERFDLIIANDAASWPLATRLADGTGSRLLFDAHEYSPREFEDIWWWRWLQAPQKRWICHNWLRRADSLLTVCPGIADEYAREFGVAKPLVLRNAPAAENVEPHPVSREHVRMIHHGTAAPSRRIETMIDLIRRLDRRFTLDLMLIGEGSSYYRSLRARAAGEPRIRFLPPVKQTELVAATNHYDVGLYLLEPNSFNNRHALPNKFFEFIQSRLALAIGPSPEMAALVREHDLGVVSADFSPASLADALQSLTPESIGTFKTNAHRAARLLCWEHESRVLLSEVRRLLALRPCAA